jgi:alkylhydroperoxidase/carboxymuconolactone decarboxylase family protein YurZ
MFDDIGEIRKQRKTYNLKMLRSGISTFGKIWEVEEEALKSGALSQQTKELIALGISIGKACYG